MILLNKSWREKTRWFRCTCLILLLRLQKIVDLGKYNDFTLLNAMDKDPNVLSAQVLNRHQDNLDLLFY
jgi:hypothetical protein